MPYPLVVNFITPDEAYRKYAAALKASCEKYGLDLFQIEIPTQGRWVVNAAMKGPFVERCLKKFNRPILWVDADAEFKDYPVLLDDLEQEFAIRAEPGGRTMRPAGRESIALPTMWPADVSPRWFNSGTCFFRPTPAVVKMVGIWSTLCQRRPGDYDQWHLQEAWTQVQPDTCWLPQAYCKIRFMRWKPGESQKAVIQHDVASSALRVHRR